MRGWRGSGADRRREGGGVWSQLCGEVGGGDGQWGVVDQGLPWSSRRQSLGPVCDNKTSTEQNKCSFDFLPSSRPLLSLPPYCPKAREQAPPQPRGLPRDPRRRPGGSASSLLPAPSALGLGVGVRWAEAPLDPLGLCMDLRRSPASGTGQESVRPTGWWVFAGV